MSTTARVFTRQFFHGTRADLEPGDTISRARWTLQSGARNWRWARGRSGFMW